MEVIAFIGIGQILLFVAWVFLKREREIKDIFLVLFLIFVGFELYYRYATVTAIKQSDFYIESFDLIYWAVFGPLLFFFIRYTINPKYKLRKSDLIHIGPILVSIPLIYVVFALSQAGQIHIECLKPGSIINRLLFFTWELYTSFYLLWSLFNLWKHQTHVKVYFSNQNEVNFQWLFYLLIGFLVYIILGSISYFFFQKFSDSEFFKISNIFILNIFVFVVGIKAIRQKIIFSQNEDYKQYRQLVFSQSNTENSLKYLKSGLNQSEKSNLKKRLEELMESDKPYLDCDLSIKDLADKLNTGIHKLSQIINESYHQNFYEYIGEYRIKEAKSLLIQMDLKKDTIINIAYDAGFNSKSAFYTNFKKHTQLTPKEYKMKSAQSPA